MIFLNDDHVGACSQLGFLNMSLNLTSALLPTRVKREHSLKFINSEYKVYRTMRPSNHSLSDWLQFLLLWLHKIRKTEINEASGVSKSSVLGENRQVRNNLMVWSNLCFLCVFFSYVSLGLNPSRIFPGKTVCFCLAPFFPLFVFHSPSTRPPLYLHLKPCPCPRTLTPSENHKL